MTDIDLFCLSVKISNIIERTISGFSIKDLIKKYNLPEYPKVVSIFKRNDDNTVNAYIRCAEADTCNYEGFFEEAFGFPAKATDKWQDLIEHCNDIVFLYKDLDISILQTLDGIFSIQCTDFNDKKCIAAFTNSLYMSENCNHYIQFDSIRKPIIDLIKTIATPNYYRFEPYEENFYFFFEDLSIAKKVEKLLSTSFNTEYNLQKANKYKHRVTVHMSIDEMMRRFIDIYVKNFWLLFYDRTDKKKVKSINEMLNYFA